MNGVIAAGSQYTVNAGHDMLMRGGNAVDAAVAAAFASFCSEVALVQLGGSGVANVYDPTTQTGRVYDFFSNMPGLSADGSPFQLRDDLDFANVIIDFGATTQSFQTGRGSVALPGNIFGLCKLAAERGTLPLHTLLEPAQTLARDGVLLSDFQAYACNLLTPLLTHTRSMRTIFWQNGRMTRSGERIYIPQLHETLIQLADEGADLLRSGSLGRTFLHDQATRGGLVTQADLDHYQVYEREPLHVTYRGHDVLLPPACSVGGILIAFTLKILSHFDFAQCGPQSADFQAIFYNAMQATAQARVMLDQAAANEQLADVVDTFLSAEHVNRYAERVARACATDTPLLQSADYTERPNTSHISVIDGNGMAVSITTTAGETAGYVVPNSGFICNNMLGEADLNPLGWHKWTPGQRLPTMMAPAIVLRDGNVRLVTGSGGSERIRSALLQIISQVVDYDQPLQSAVNAPRLHVQRDVLQVEGGFDSDAVGRFEARGYQTNRWNAPSMYFGGAHSVAVQDEQLVAVGDRRRDGCSA